MRAVAFRALHESSLRVTGALGTSRSGSTRFPHAGQGKVTGPRLTAAKGHRSLVPPLVVVVKVVWWKAGGELVVVVEGQRF